MLPPLFRYKRSPAHASSSAAVPVEVCVVSAAALIDWPSVTAPEECSVNLSSTVSSTAGATVEGIVPVFGTVQLPNFEHYDAQYGVGGNPQGWGWISGPHLAQVRDGWLAEWDTTHLEPGLYTLLITAFDREQHRVEARVQVNVANPTKTPTSTPTSTPTPTSTSTPSPTPTMGTTPSPTLTPNPSPVPTETPWPTATATLVPAITPTVVVTTSQIATQAVGVHAPGGG